MRNAIWNAGRRLMVGTALMVGLLGTGAVAANAQSREFRGGHESARRFERPAYRGYERGYDRGYENRYRPGFGVAIGVPYEDAYIPPCPGEGYVWLGGEWVFRGGYGGGYRGGYRYEHERWSGGRGNEQRRFDGHRGRR